MYDNNDVRLWMHSEEYHFRGYLPHLEQKPVQIITFRMADSVPMAVVDGWKREMELQGWQKDERMKMLQKKIDRYEDEGYGCCRLRDERVAKTMEDTLFHYDGMHYRLIRWCIMPNHVHVMIEVQGTNTLSTIVKEWKSYTSHEAKRITGQGGRFWMHEYYDRYIRDIVHYHNAIAYIDTNPVKAGLVQNASEWRWSSAYWEALNGGC